MHRESKEPFSLGAEESDKRYKKIKLSSYREIAERKIEKVKRELSNKTSELNNSTNIVKSMASQASEAATDLDNIISTIVFAVCKLALYNEPSSIEAKISSIHESGGDLNRGTQRQFLEIIFSEDDLRSRIFGTFVVKFFACLPLLGFSNI